MVNIYLKYFSMFLQAISVAIGSFGFLMCLYYFISDNVEWHVLAIGLFGVILGFCIYKLAIVKIYDDRW